MEPDPRLTRTVYSIYWPETRSIVDDLWRSRPHHLYERNYRKRQDAMHHPFLAEWRKWSEKGGLELGPLFHNGYPTNGASEAIDHLILPGMRVNVFKGEYEGYAAIAKARGVPVVEHDRAHTFDGGLAFDYNLVHRDVFFVSVPSSLDGEYWNGFDEWLRQMECDHPHIPVYVDVTYLGAATRPERIRLADRANVAAVIFSLSKPFGVYYFRVGGIVSRRPIDSLWGNLWFKNLFSVQLGTELLRATTPQTLPGLYAPVQAKALAAMQRDGLLAQNVEASNVVLLARSKDGPAEYRRAAGFHRYCLSPDMDKLINPTAHCDTMEETSDV